MSGVVCGAWIIRILDRALTTVAGLFSSFDCAVKGIRKKEDPYNASTLMTSTEAAASDLG